MHFKRSQLLPTLALIAAALSSGCTPSQQNEHIASHSNTVPVFRPLPLEHMTYPLVIDFDVPPPPKSASPALVIGIRTRGNEVMDSFEAARLIRHSKLQATVALTRVDSGHPDRVQMLTSAPTPDDPHRDEIVGEDGQVRHPQPTDVIDVASATDASVRTSQSYRYLELAWVRDIAPGRYQLSVQLTDAPEATQHVESDLIVAYHRRSK